MHKVYMYVRMRVSVGLRGDACVTSYVKYVACICTSTLTGVWSEQFTLMLFDSVVFLEGAQLQQHIYVYCDFSVSIHSDDRSPSKLFRLL
jgi:hypothetical protein